MHLLFDNLLATIIGSTLVLMMVANSLEHRQVMTKATAFYSATTQTEQFIQILRRDMQGVVQVQAVEEDATTLRFPFTARIGQDPTLRTVVYERVLVHHREETGAVYRIRRLVDGVEQGGSGDIVTDWAIQALNEQGQAITAASNLGNCRQIRIQLETTVPFEALDGQDGLLWESTFYPPLRNQTQLY